jgi:hypothetical protein
VPVCAGLCRFVFVPVCAGLCQFVPVCAILCGSSVFLQADRFLTPFFCKLKLMVDKKVGKWFQSPSSPQKKLYLISSRANYE